MNSDILKGKWKQMRGEAKKWWGKLTDDELDQINGERDILVGKVQERYGWTKEKAEAEVDRHLSVCMANSLSSSRPWITRTQHGARPDHAIRHTAE